MNKGFTTTRILRADDVAKTVTTAEGELAILDGVSLEINAGESIAVVGASGSGKTTLAASYVDDRDLNCFWYCCEEADSDLATFFYHLRATGNRLLEPRKNKLLLLQPEYALGVTTFGKNFFRTLYSKVPAPGC